MKHQKASNIQLVIPMTGSGKRFQNAGYTRLKPFIEIFGKPMIEWVVQMFIPIINRIIFVCNKTHIDNLPYVRKELIRIAPQSEIIVLENTPWKGPSPAILGAASAIDVKDPVLVSYCDYYMHWEYSYFLHTIFQGKFSGAVPCYTGFHPHLIPKKNVYASCSVDASDKLIEIREKFSWEIDKTHARHSPGLYYFQSGDLLIHYCRQSLRSNDQIDGEYYTSLLYNHMVCDGLSIWCPTCVSHFCQWGTPQDLEEFLFWITHLQEPLL